MAAYSIYLMSLLMLTKGEPPTTDSSNPTQLLSADSSPVRWLGAALAVTYKVRPSEVGYTLHDEVHDVLCSRIRGKYHLCSLLQFEACLNARVDLEALYLRDLVDKIAQCVHRPVRQDFDVRRTYCETHTR
jgi:hypothetical protein